VNQIDRLVILVAGLSASGHYTEKDKHEFWEDQIKRTDLGEEWKEDGEACRYCPTAIEDAMSLLRVINRVEEMGVKI
jgi:hypothetical protein